MSTVQATRDVDEKVREAKLKPEPITPEATGEDANRRLLQLERQREVLDGRRHEITNEIVKIDQMIDAEKFRLTRMGGG